MKGFLISVALAASVGLSGPAAGQQRTKRGHPHRIRTVSAAGPRGAVLATVARFEAAYQRKDKHTMLFVLMAPTQDADAFDRRYEWYRGYGPHDLPGSRHPPILFETSRGSFVPTSYAVRSAAASGPTRWTVTVREHGTYKDEDGRWKVTRDRVFTIVRVKASWLVSNYVLAQNPADYGFWVDDIIDKMSRAQP